MIYLDRYPVKASLFRYISQTTTSLSANKMEVTLSAAGTTLFSISKTLDCSSQTCRSQLTLLNSRRITTTTNAVFRRPSANFGSTLLVGLGNTAAPVSPVSHRHECLSSSAAGVDDVPPLSSDVIVLDVKGMMCEGCASSVKRMLENQAQVSSASVNLATETATVWPLSEAKATPNWQKVIGEDLAKHLTTCGFNSTLKP